MNRSNDIREQQREQRVYRLLVYGGAVIALLILIVVLILRNYYQGPQRFLISDDADSLLFEILIVLSGAAFGSAVVGTIFDQHQRRFAGQRSEALQRLAEEGIVNVYSSATDPALLKHVRDLVESARYEITFVGLGLGLLAHNQELLAAIGERLKQQEHLRVTILFGDSNNEGVKNRVEEEADWHSKKGLSYDRSWVTRYPAEIKSILGQVVGSADRNRVRVEAVADCVPITVCKIDDVLLFFSYGPPSIRGSQSPWIVVDVSLSSGHLGRFLQKTLSHYKPGPKRQP